MGHTEDLIRISVALDRIAVEPTDFVLEVASILEASGLKVKTNLARKSVSSHGRPDIAVKAKPIIDPPHGPLEEAAYNKILGHPHRGKWEDYDLRLVFTKDLQALKMPLKLAKSGYVHVGRGSTDDAKIGVNAYIDVLQAGINKLRREVDKYERNETDYLWDIFKKADSISWQTDPYQKILSAAFSFSLGDLLNVRDLLEAEYSEDELLEIYKREWLDS